MQNGFANMAFFSLSLSRKWCAVLVSHDLPSVLKNGKSRRSIQVNMLKYTQSHFMTAQNEIRWTNGVVPIHYTSEIVCVRYAFALLLINMHYIKNSIVSVITIIHFYSKKPTHFLMVLQFELKIHFDCNLDFQRKQDGHQIFSPWTSRSWCALSAINVKFASHISHIVSGITCGSYGLMVFLEGDQFVFTSWRTMRNCVWVAPYPCRGTAISPFIPASCVFNGSRSSY